jgi:hypothetical protein
MPHAHHARAARTLQLSPSERLDMPTKKLLERVAKDRRKGKSPGTQAGELVREEIHHVRKGKHGARSAKQLIAIGLSKARRAGVALPPPKDASAKVRQQAARDSEAGRTHHKPSPARSRASRKALEHEGSAAASHKALSLHAHAVAARVRRKKG